MANVWKKFKQKIKVSLEKMAEENKKEFGSTRLDCCNLNKKDKARR